MAGLQAVGVQMADRPEVDARAADLQGVGVRQGGRQAVDGLEADNPVADSSWVMGRLAAQMAGA